MNEPAELSSRARAFVDARRDEGAPSASDKQRVRLAALAALTIPGSATATASTGVKATVAAKGSLGLVAAGIVSVMVGIGAVLVIRGARPEPVSEPPPAPAPAVVPMVATLPPEPVAELPKLPAAAVDEQVESPPAPRRVPARQVRTAPPPVAVAAKDPSAEFALLAEVRAVTRAGDGARALALLDAFDAKFGTGAVLREEALAARVLANCAARQVPEAKAAEAALRQQNAASVHLRRVANACW